jgi:predicted nucleic acid-binding protein
LTQVRDAGMAPEDLRIAAAAVLEEAPLTTVNARHFAKVPGLLVVGS